MLPSGMVLVHALLGRGVVASHEVSSFTKTAQTESTLRYRTLNLQISDLRVEIVRGSCIPSLDSFGLRFCSSFGGEVVGARDEAMPQPRHGEGRHGQANTEGTHVVTLMVVGRRGIHGLRHLKVGDAET